MLLYKVDYLLKDLALYKQTGVTLPTYVVANGFEAALKKAKEYENENATVHSCGLFVDDGLIVIT